MARIRRLRTHGVFPFTALPLELRRLVYRKALTRSTIEVRRTSGLRTGFRIGFDHHRCEDICGCPDAPILSTCRTIYLEAIEFLYHRTTTFIIKAEDILGLATFLMKLGNNRKRIQMIRYEWSSDGDWLQLWTLTAGMYGPLLMLDTLTCLADMPLERFEFQSAVEEENNWRNARNDPCSCAAKNYWDKCDKREWLKIYDVLQKALATASTEFMIDFWSATLDRFRLDCDILKLDIDEPGRPTYYHVLSNDPSRRRLSDV